MVIGTIVGHNASLPLGFVKSLLGVKEYDFITQEGPSISDNRNKVFERARFERQSLLFIDSDMVFTAKDVKQMEEDLKTMDIVTGVCVMSFPSYPASLFKKEGNSYKPTEPQKEVFEIDGCGAAFLGLSLKIVDDLTEPFTPRLDNRSGRSYGEDISFCALAQERGYKIWCDPKLQIGHIKTDVKYYIPNLPMV